MNCDQPQTDRASQWPGTTAGETSLPDTAPPQSMHESRMRVG
jgi:hypothetical protein